MSGSVNGREVLLGTEAWLAARGVPVDPALTERAEQLRAAGATVVLVVIGGRVAGAIAVADPIKDTTPAAIARLREAGVSLVMATGDNRRTAAAVAAELGLGEVLADLLPEQKAAEVQRLQAAGHVVAVAGDGINDAPALARADVGIAMGDGTDVALEAADVTLVRGDLRGIAQARALSEATVRNIKQNLFWAFGYNLLSIPIAAGVLFPLIGVLLTPTLAAAAMSFSSVSVIGNALRLRPPPGNPTQAAGSSGRRKRPGPRGPFKQTGSRSRLKRRAQTARPTRPVQADRLQKPAQTARFKQPAPAPAASDPAEAAGSSGRAHPAAGTTGLRAIVR